MAKSKDGQVKLVLTKDGKTDWPATYARLNDGEALREAVRTLGKMPMTYLKALSERLKKVKAAA